MTDRPAPTDQPPIGDHALLSDCHSVALVDRDATIDWACLRRFDAGSTFARLLDAERGGAWSITPRDEVVDRSRRYLPRTMVLETTLTTASGTITVTDAFAMRAGGAEHPRQQLLRVVRATEGSVEVDVEVTPRFDYGATSRPWVRVQGDRAIAIGGDDALIVAASTDLHDGDDAIRCSTSVTPDAPLVLTARSQLAHRAALDHVDAGEVDELLDETVAWWTGWSSRTVADGPYAEVVERSALVLKSLTCAPTGAVVAAPTTSLPEVVGGSANWDYRYCWVRDASMVIDALASTGHHEVARGFRDFVMRSSAGHGDELQIMFGPYGERRLPEIELELSGYRGSRPVRVGNAASTQTQLDVFGHLLAAAHRWNELVDEGEIDPDEWRFLASVVDRAADSWQRTDAGIWELRRRPRHHVHSKVMTWVALDRGVHLVEEYGLECRTERLEDWRAARRAVRAAVEDRGVDPTGSHFVSCFDGSTVDASLLRLTAFGFVEPSDPRMVATVDAIRERLTTPIGFVRRFEPDDGADDALHGEGSFLLCTCWLVEALCLQGRRDEARELFERLLDVGNDLHLFAEEFDEGRGELLGNFPQAFTHLGIVEAALRLADDG